MITVATSGEKIPFLRMYLNIPLDQEIHFII